MPPELDHTEETESGDRFYVWADGETYPSVTTITSRDPEAQRQIANWRQRQDDPESALKRAQIRGILAHHRILNPIAIRELDPPDFDVGFVDGELRTDVEVCEALWDQLDLAYEDPYVEKAVRSPRGYAGRADLLAEVDGERCVIDLKTSKAIQSGHKMQISAYYMAIRDHIDDLPSPEKAMIVGLNPRKGSDNLSPHTETFDESQLQGFYDNFLALLNRFEDDLFNLRGDQ